MHSVQLLFCSLLLLLFRLLSSCVLIVHSRIDNGDTVSATRPPLDPQSCPRRRPLKSFPTFFLSLTFPIPAPALCRPFGIGCGSHAHSPGHRLPGPLQSLELRVPTVLCAGSVPQRGSFRGLLCSEPPSQCQDRALLETSLAVQGHL